jgi:formylglycine-generating enzyme required for sulfatase activity
VSSNSYVDWDANGYRLPTEVEWEIAARYINGTNWRNGDEYSGGTDADMVSWHSGNSGGKTQSVGQKQPNELGIYDMTGNASEYVWDRWDLYTNNSPYIDANTKGPETNPNGSRSIRGGSWRTTIESGKLYISYRTYWVDYDTRGFRIAKNN